MEPASDACMFAPPILRAWTDSYRGGSLMHLARTAGPPEPTRYPTPRSANRHHPGAEIFLDSLRVRARALHPTPTGIDRLEMAYARTLQRLFPDRLSFGAVHPTGFYGGRPPLGVAEFLDRTERRWQAIGDTERPAQARRVTLRHCWMRRPQRIPPARGAHDRLRWQALTLVDELAAC